MNTVTVLCLVVNAIAVVFCANNWLNAENPKPLRNKALLYGIMNVILFFLNLTVLR